MPDNKQNTAKQAEKPANKPAQFVFERENYILLIAAFAIIVIGYFLMSGGGSDDPKVFSEEIFSSRRLVVAPIVILAGFVLGIFAILKKPKA